MVDHIRFGEDAASPGDGRWPCGFHSQSAELFIDRNPQAIRLLIKKGASPRSTYLIEGMVYNNRPPLFLIEIQENQLRILSPNLDNRPDLRVVIGNSPSLGNNLVLFVYMQDIGN
jgi:hypothetical protein